MEPNADKNTRIINIGAVILAALVIIGGTLWYTGALSFGEPRMPSFERPTTFPVDFTEETKTLFNEDVAALKERIRLNSKDWSAWLDLAIRYRMVNDNDGAVLIWEYLRKSNPEDGVALHNLGGHYFYEEKNYRKAETYYRESIEVAPVLSINYTSLFDMYRYVYKTDTDAAVEILKEGIEKVGEGEALDMRIMLGRYLAEKEDIEGARTYLTEARDAARTLGNTQLVAIIEAELALLK